MDRLRTAVVGPGRIARAHLRAVRRNDDVAALAAVVGLPEEAERTRALAAEFGAERASDNLEEILGDPHIDAVVLTLPNHLHRPIAVKALDFGKHVLVEKPLATTVADAEAIVAAAARAGRTLMTAQCRRFFAGALEAKRRVEQLGRPLDIIHVLGVNADAPKADWWRSAKSTGGLVLGLNGPHVFDTILWLMGERPVDVYARIARMKPYWEGEDQATVVLSFEDGSTATGHLSLNMRPDVNERWIVGPKGSMRLVHDRTLWVGEEKVIDEELVPYIEGDASFDGQFREFALSIREGREPMASGQEVVAVVEVMEAAWESAGHGRPVTMT
jgi:predicted dehydrogenase